MGDETLFTMVRYIGIGWDQLSLEALSVEVNTGVAVVQLSL